MSTYQRQLDALAIVLTVAPFSVQSYMPLKMTCKALYRKTIRLGRNVYLGYPYSTRLMMHVTDSSRTNESIAKVLARVHTFVSDRDVADAPETLRLLLAQIPHVRLQLPHESHTGDEWMQRLVDNDPDTVARTQHLYQLYIDRCTIPFAPHVGGVPIVHCTVCPGLESLEHFTDTKSLVLEDCPVRNFVGPQHLKTLVIARRVVGDLSPILDYPALTRLTLHGVHFNHLAFLANRPLQRLEFQHCTINSCAGANRIETLIMDECTIRAFHRCTPTTVVLTLCQLRLARDDRLFATTVCIASSRRYRIPLNVFDAVQTLDCVHARLSGGTLANVRRLKLKRVMVSKISDWTWAHLERLECENVHPVFPADKRHFTALVDAFGNQSAA